MFAVPEVVPEGRTSHGSWAFTCPSETKYRPAGIPLKVTDVPSILAERGIVSPGMVAEARPLPKIATRPPGATAWPLAKLAPLMTPPLKMDGCAAATPANIDVQAANRASLSIRSPRLTISLDRPEQTREPVQLIPFGAKHLDPD